jgi:Mg-chelatase subunit ChlD
VGVVALAIGLLAPSIGGSSLSVPAAQAGSIACTTETEPNDTPEQAQAIGGAVCVTAALPEGDQDLFAWELSAEQAKAAWSIGLTGVPNTITTVTLLPIDSAPGVVPVVLGSRLIDLSSSPSYAPPPSTQELLLAPGRYLVGVARSGTPDGGTPVVLDYQFELIQGSARPAARDREPNDDAAHATPVSGAFALSGDVQSGMDYFAWTLSAAEAKQRRQLNLQGQLGASTNLTLETAKGDRLAQIYATEDGRVDLRDLALPAGTYIVVVGSPGDSPRPYRLSSALEPGARQDAEPNDDAAHAIRLDPARPVAVGRLSQYGDRDNYRLHVDDNLAALLLDIKLVWQDGPQRTLCLFDSHAVELGCRASDGGDSLSNLFLPVGDYTIEVRGEASLADPYLLRVDPTSAPEPDFETEPNDQAIYASAWDGGTLMLGRQVAGDVDYFKVSVAGVAQLWRLDATGLQIDNLRQVKRDGTVLAGADIAPDRKSAVLEDIYFVPGDHWVRIDGIGDYSLRLTPQGPPDPNAEHEPNNDSASAEPLAIGKPRIGRLVSPNDVDISRFSLAAAEHLHLTLTPPSDGSVTYRLYQANTEVGAQRTAEVGVPINADFVLPAGDYELWLQPGQVSRGRYTVQLDRTDPFDAAAPLAATLSLTTITRGVAAYWSAGQRVDGYVHLFNTGQTDQALTLDTRTSHYAWSATTSQTQLNLPAGGSASIPFSVHVQPDAWADVPVRVTVRARDAFGAQQTAYVELTPSATAPPAKPEQAWPVPQALLGGLNVASLALGGAPVSLYDADAEARLYDGVTPAGGGFYTYYPTLPVTLTSDLAGDAAVPVAGVMLNPQAHDAGQAEAPRDFRLLLSTDGSTWAEALAGQLTPLPIDQAFVLPAPVSARFARIEILNTYGTGTTVSLGEFKVIATPGSSPTTTPLNIAEPIKGGHVVRMDPQPPDTQFGPEMLAEDSNPLSQSVPAGARPQWVVGFQNDRAALISQLEWVDPSPTDAALRFTNVAVATSLESPLGPWIDQGNWQLTRTADGSVKPFTFKQPTWARFVRYTGNASKDAVYREVPATLRIIEQPQTAGYRSVLGEFGTGPDGSYEIQHPPALTVPDYAIDPNNTPDAATQLAAGTTASSTVHTGEDVDWYAVSAPAGQNTLAFSVAGSPVVGVSLVLQDSTGASVPMKFGPGTEPGTVRYTATVTPGAAYRVQVQQPPFSAVFSYDTSGSMGNYLAFVSEALRAFSSGVVPGREAVQIVPFEAPPLIDEWSDDPYALQNALEAEVDLGGSSSAETALINATDLLAKREGARAILLVTDAETSSFERTAEMWMSLDAVRPLIFAVHVGANTSAAESQHMMQDWAGSSNGFYQYTRTHGEMDRAFDRMATWLERPSAYKLSYDASFVKPPATTGAPGTLSVVGVNNGDPAKVPVAANAAIELILDTSGSMLERLEGRRRIDVAQSVLTRLVRDKLPPGVPLAFRVFGDTANSCQTRLAVPLGPLDAAEMVGQIQGIRVLSSVNTPIGAALKQVASDLKGVSGPRIVVLVTDGQENCGGDPAAAVKALARAGLDVHVNIVGFQIGTKALRSQMAGWAKLGRGSFFNATSSGDLNAAIAQAVSAPFRVVDKNGKVVATGTVNGSPLRLPPGTYRVEVLTDPVVTFEAVVVAPNGSVQLTLPAAPAP